MITARRRIQEVVAQDDPAWPHLRLALAIFSTAAVDAIKSGDEEAIEFIDNYGGQVAGAQARFNRRVRKNCGDININYIRRKIGKAERRES